MASHLNGPSPSSSSPRGRASAMDREWGTLKLKRLAEQLRSYKIPTAHDTAEDDSQETAAGVTSSVGVPESAAAAKGDPIFATSRKRAAVLVCIFQNDDGELRVILTKRASSLSSHSGEVALPGGKKDAEDVDDVATALREAEEEIGLNASSVRVVTLLEPFLSKHLLRVAPVVALLPDKSLFKPVPNRGEVDDIFDAPLEMFLKDEKHHSEKRDWLGYFYRIHYFDYDYGDKRYLIWGLTASILIRCASVIYQHPPAFEDSYLDIRTIDVDKVKNSEGV